MAQAFGHAAFPVDTHIHRLAARWGLSDGSNVVKTERDLKGLFPEATWNKLHLQIIFFGREHCKALHHDMAACPICSFASPRGIVAALVKSKKATTPKSNQKPESEQKNQKKRGATLRAPLS
jgi:endonuclease-3